MLSLWQASPPAGPVDAEVRDHTPHRMGCRHTSTRAHSQSCREAGMNDLLGSRAPPTAVSGRNK